MNEGIQLFGRGSRDDYRIYLSNRLEATAQDVANRINRLGAEDLLDRPTETVNAELVKSATVTCPRLLADKAWLQPAVEVTKQFVEFGEPVSRKVTRLVLVVPYEGEQVVFTLRANTSSLNPPRVLRLETGELHLVLDGPPDDGAAVRAAFDAQIEKIEQYLGWSRLQIEAHNQRIIDEVPGLAQARREQLLSMRKLQGDTGYPTSPPEDRG